VPDPSTDAVGVGSWFGVHTALAAVAVGLVTYVGFSGAQLIGMVSADAPVVPPVADPPIVATYPSEAASPEPSEPARTRAPKVSRSEERPTPTSDKAAPSRPAATSSAAPKPAALPTGKSARDPLARRQPSSIQRAHWADRQIAAMLRTMPASPMTWFTGGTSWVLPTTGYHLTARFGESGSHWSSTHTGLDFATSTGTPVRAATGGTVTFAGYDGSYGNKIEITHADGSETWYAHMSQLYATVGTPVATGTVIGAVGATGNVTGPHLHFEVRPGGDSPIDPYPFLLQHGLHP
jgi:murein DD-endopeptidase MepM/ murein hydrolase activator NlpD